MQSVMSLVGQGLNSQKPYPPPSRPNLSLVAIDCRVSHRQTITVGELQYLNLQFLATDTAHTSQNVAAGSHGPK